MLIIITEIKQTIQLALIKARSKYMTVMQINDTYMQVSKSRSKELTHYILTR